MASSPSNLEGLPKSSQFTKGTHLRMRGTLDLYIMYNRAPDKREYLVIFRDNFCKFCIKTYLVTPHLIRLFEMVQMSDHIIWFQ